MNWCSLIYCLVTVIFQFQASSGQFHENDTFIYNNNNGGGFGLEESDLSNLDSNGLPYSLNEQLSRRKSKLFPLFTIIRFTNEPCQGSDPLERGICYTRKQCTNNFGVSIGTCAQGLGVCCQFYTTCGNTITQNNTLFRNPDFPNKYRPTAVGDICQVRIRKQPNVCQLRLNFIKFDIDGPNGPPTGTVTAMNDGGNCKTDALTVTSGGSIAPNVCGNMVGQHLYLDYGSSDTLTLNIMVSSMVNRDREWSIEVLMIPCRSESRAPSGCLQYFQGVSGQIQSFNYGGIHLANLDYSSCIRMEEGMRSIEWTSCTVGDVKISGVPATLATLPPTAPLLCTPNIIDYLLIPGGLAFPLPTTTPMMFSTIDRYCDIHFAQNTQTVRSVVRPFLLHIRTDNGELVTGPGDASTGYCLRWQQSPQGLI